MMQDPSIDDRMTANGYVRCGGCGGILPAGAICGYCLQKQQGSMQMPIATPRPAARPARPLKTAFTIGICTLLAAGVGVASLLAIRSVGKIGHLAAGSSS